MNNAQLLCYIINGTSVQEKNIAPKVGCVVDVTVLSFPIWIAGILPTINNITHQLTRTHSYVVLVH